MNTAPSPLMLATKIAKVAIVTVEPTTPTTLDPARIIKAKHLRPKQKVQAIVQDQLRGRVNTVDRTTRINDGAEVEIAWEDGEPSITRKAAFRYYLIADVPGQRSRSKAGAVRRARVHDEHLSTSVEAMLDADTVVKLADVRS